MVAAFLLYRLTPRVVHHEVPRTLTPGAAREAFVSLLTWRRLSLSAEWKAAEKERSKAMPREGSATPTVENPFRKG